MSERRVLPNEMCRTGYRTTVIAERQCHGAHRFAQRHLRIMSERRVLPNEVRRTGYRITGIAERQCHGAHRFAQWHGS